VTDWQDVSVRVTVDHSLRPEFHSCAIGFEASDTSTFLVRPYCLTRLSSQAVHHYHRVAGHPDAGPGPRPAHPSPFRLMWRRPSKMDTKWFAILLILVSEANEAHGFLSQPTHILRAPSTASWSPSGRMDGSWVCTMKANSEMEIKRRDMLLSGFALGSLLVMPQNTFADMTLETFKRAYYRYVPRIEAGELICHCFLRSVLSHCLRLRARPLRFKLALKDR
jgi:hypothetical protein